ncbi:MAG TPA: UvrD-helicase domain-containing protein [Polyangiaceae bacterium]|nr:UvrD-helicase domain-containing protein [Polyangiaceae bacterium]
MSAAGITIIGASAGSGKTHRLTQDVIAAVSVNAGAGRVDLAGLVAVTFTKRAHVELEARIRHKLVEDEAYDEAMRLPLAYLGTVHAAALRLLQEFAIDAGLSPSVDVVAGNETKLLRQAFERSLDEHARQRLDELAARLELRIDHRTRRTDWVTPVADIMSLARSNRIAPSALAAMADRSAMRLLALLPPPASDAGALDRALARELDAAIASLSTENDPRKNTAEALSLLRTSRERLADSELRWSDWSKLADVAPSKRSEIHVLGVRVAAARYGEHPRLHQELRDITHAIFDAARAGLVAYQEWKRDRRVVDYVDMIDGALDLVDHGRVRADLSRRLQLIVVDEFQDTSPIQLAFFIRLHALAGRSIWVGDRKQCIFEYAGADPILMDAVTEWVERNGGRPDRLGANHRSRPELVHACSEVFAAALARHGFTREEVVVAPVRPALEALEALPPLGFWALDVENASDDAEAVGEGVRLLLAEPHATPVLDRVTKEVRPLRPSDVAVLVATNEWAVRLAEALHARGVRAAIARAGLFATPEGTLVEAALRWLLDSGDLSALSVIEALTGWAGLGPDAWLTQRLRDATASSESRRVTAPTAELSGWRGALDALRTRLTVLAPAEALAETLAALDAVLLCARWPDPAQRVANLDALRATAASYEARCAQEREAATVAGMLRYFEILRSPSLQGDEILASDDQHVPTDDGAVVVCTYHKAKGLEWPVVVLANLDRGERRDAFEVTPESLGGTFEPERPLANRSIRYWPWPLGATQNAPLADAAAASPEGRQVSQREDKERARLLYVGFTRARDHLVLAARVSKQRPKRAWLNALCSADGKPLVELPVTALDGTVAQTAFRIGSDEVAPLSVPTRVYRLRAERSDAQGTRNDAPAPVWFARPLVEAADTRAHAAYRIVPSAGTNDWPELEARVNRSRLGAIEHLPSAIRCEAGQYEDDVLGNAVHAFLAADVEGLDDELRLARARELTHGAGLAGIVRAESLLVAGDALRSWVRAKWPDAIWHREIPIERTITSDQGERRVSGVVDLLLETPTAYVIIDHKTFPAKAASAWRAKCAGFIPQLAAYAILLDAVGEKKVGAAWVHLPVGGGMMEVVLGDGGGG